MGREEGLGHSMVWYRGHTR